MKVILLRDVAKTGFKNQVVEVADGLALNKLFPKGDAKPANAHNLKMMKNLQVKNNVNSEKIADKLKYISEKFAKDPLVITTKANEKGHLFKAIHAEDIREALNAESIKLDKNIIKIEKTIKELGDHEITLKNGEMNFALAIKINKK